MSIRLPRYLRWPASRPPWSRESNGRFPGFVSYPVNGVVDTLEIRVFLYKHLYLTAVLFAFFVFLAVLGLRAWKQALQEEEFGNPKTGPALIRDFPGLA